VTIVEITKLGILGGTFDPPHIGHLILAQSAIEKFQLDKILFMPAARQPHKQNQEVTSAEIRLRLLKLAVKGNSRFEISDIEIKRSGVSYTCDTLKELSNIYLKARLYLIIGGDNINDIETWKNPEQIFSMAQVIAATRPDSKPECLYMDRIDIFNMPQVDISSTMIRKLVKHGKSIKYLVPDDIEKYIIENNLYA